MSLRAHTPRPSQAFSLRLIAVALVILSTISCVTASDLINSHHQHTSDLAKKLVGDAQLRYDTGRAPVVRFAIERRQVGGSGDDSSSSSTATKTAKSTKTASSSATITSGTSNGTTNAGNSTASSTSTSATPSYTAKGLPIPFDTSIGNNFTNSNCPAFFQSFLANSTFRSCAPVSLLLQNSLSFFQAVRSPPVLGQTLDNSCSASLAVCSPLMSSIASNLVSDSNCGADFRRQNPLVTQAYAGLTAYEVMYKASCLKNTTTNTYCFWDAFTNADNNTNGAADSYPYYTAIGIAMPSSTTPDCTDCLRQTMQIFAGYAKMKGQPLTGTYVDTAKQLDAVCGPNFADTSVQVAVQSNVNAASALGGSPVIASILMALISIASMLT